MRAPSVSGIGNVGSSHVTPILLEADGTVEKPDMSEAKIVVAMVCELNVHKGELLTIRSVSQLGGSRTSVTSSCDTFE